jgi:hypothetical protein
MTEPVPSTVTIESVSPARGHTGGRTLVEIQGSGFREPPAPDLTHQGELPAPPSTVRVLFGETPARSVAVAGSDLLFVETPIHDPGTVDVTVQNLDYVPARLTTDEQPFALSAGQTLVVTVGSEPEQLVTVEVADVASPGAATATEVAAILNRIRGARALAIAEGRVQLESDARGPSATLEFVGGTALAALGLSPGEVVGSSDLEPLAEQQRTLVDGYEFVLPRLDVKPPIVLAFEQLIVELGRQVLPNVHVATHTDYDESTGDQLNMAYLATLPALVLTSIETQDAPARVVRGRRLVAGSEEDHFVERTHEDVVDVRLNIVAVTNSAPELLALFSTLRGFFRKNPKLEVGPHHLGDDGYDIDWQIGNPAGVTVTSDNSGIVTMSGSCAIRGVELGAILIGDEGTLPSGAPSDVPHDASRAMTWANDTTEVSTTPKDT